MKRAFPRPSSAAGLVLIALTASACATTPAEEAAPPEPEVMDVAGLYDASFDVQGQVLTGTMEIRQDGTDLTATFDSPMGVTADGSGVISGDQVGLELDYMMECPGTARLEGRVRDEGARISGTFTASDCTGGGSGGFSLVR